MKRKDPCLECDDDECIGCDEEFYRMPTLRKKRKPVFKASYSGTHVKKLIGQIRNKTKEIAKLNAFIYRLREIADDSDGKLKSKAISGSDILSCGEESQAYPMTRDQLRMAIINEIDMRV
jgi:hypothetical protein